MNAIAILPPYPVFSDVDGEPLEDGYIYIGQSGLNPETNPVIVYFDKDLSIPAAQPLRTLGGYIHNSGSTTNIFTSLITISITIRNKNGTLIYTNLNASVSNIFGSLYKVGSVQELVDSFVDLSINEVTIESYEEVIYPSVTGSVGGHKAHRTGGTSNLPTKGSPVGVGTIGTGDQAGYYFDQFGNEWVISDDQVINSSMFGVYDNTGTVEMGAQLEQFFNYINNISGTRRIDVNFLEGVYLITGGTNQALSGFGTVEGLIPLTRDNLTLNLKNVEFKVPDSFIWRRTQIGGGDQDHFARGFYISGENCWMFGGLLNGNLRNRTITRGPTANNYGGNEIGLRVYGRGFRGNRIISREWGTDCHYQVTGDAFYNECEFYAGRRLCSAIVGEEPWTESDPVVFFNCTFAEAGTYSDADYNRPASGVDIESDGAFPGATFYLNCIFRDNRKYNIQMSNGAKDCIFNNNDFFGATQSWAIGAAELIFNSFNKQPAAEGGHVWSNNRFHDNQLLETIYGTAAEDPSYVIDNFFKTTANMVVFRTSSDYPPPWYILNNTAPACLAPTFRAGGGPDIENGNVTAVTIDEDGKTEINLSGSLAVGVPVTVSLIDFLNNDQLIDDATYEMWGKINNGSGTWDGYGHYIFTFNGGALEGVLVITEAAGSGRSVVYGAGDVVFDTASFASTYGFTIRRIGGVFGT